jgi:ribosome biogenesis GTPase
MRATPTQSEIPGRVMRVDRGQCDVMTEAGMTRALWRAAGPSEIIPCVGDLVRLSAVGEMVTLTAIEPRHSAITRIDAAPGSSEHQVLAANVDVAAICEPCHPQPTLARVERLLALAWESGAQPVVILTKADLADDLESTVADVRALVLGVQLLTVVATTGEGLDAVASLITPGQTLALLGRSGAGKSTLLNALIGEPVMPTSRLRSDGRGRHTTTHRQMLALPNGGFIIDTPGVKGVGIPTAEGLDQVFADVEELASECRFGDCSHTVEPGCAVLEAVDDGVLLQRRLDSYRKLQREAAYQARRTDARLAAQERARWKSIHKELRRSQSARP